MKIKARNIDELYLKYSLDSGRKYYLASVLFQALAFIWILAVFSIVFWKMRSYTLEVMGSIVETFFILAMSHFYRKAMSVIEDTEILHMKIDDETVKVIKNAIFFGDDSVTVQGRAMYSDAEFSYM